MTQAISHSSSALHPWFIAPGAALFVTAFVSDLIYWWTMAVEWATFAIWLISAGLVFAALAGVAFLIDVSMRRVEAVDWGRFVFLAVAALLSLLNAFVHSRDGYAIMPEGLFLSAVVTALVLSVVWHGWSLASTRYARRVWS
jgi:uncharacterized membrane protein